MNAEFPLPGAQADDDFIDLGRLLHAIWRWKWGILGLSFAITLATGMYVMSLEPLYRASASIVLEAGESNVVNVEELYSVDTYDYNYQQTQYEILQSRNLAERVVRRLNLHQDNSYFPSEPVSEPWFDFNLDLKALLPAREKQPPIQLSAEEQELREIQSWAGWVSGGIGVSPVEYSYVVYLSFESTSAVLAARVVNTLAEEFIASNLENRVSGTIDATDFLSSRLSELKLNLREAEEALQNFREQEGLVDVQGVTGLGSAELRSLSQRLDDTRKARIEAENIRDDVRGYGEASTEQLMTIPAVLQHQLISQIKRDQSQAERRVSELAKRYGRKHPKMIAAQSDLTAANEELTQEVRKVVSGISREYDVALRNEQQLQATWEARKSEMQDFNRKEFQLLELQRDVDTNRELYDIFFTRIKGVSKTGGFEKPHARIVDRALTPTSSHKPNKRLSVTLAFALGIVLGCGIAILLDVLDNTVKTPDEVREKLGVSLLGAIPKQPVDSTDSFEQFWENPQSQYAEAIRTLRTSVVLSALDAPAKIIVVTSTVPGEGKSTTALNLGAALAQMESTLVIGGDLRRPSLAQKCSLAPNHQGLSHFVSGTAELENCYEYLEELKLHVMPAGVIPPNPLEMISSKRFVDALQVLGERFERIVIDSAPVQAVSDALILASYAQSVIYVVKADSTSATQARKGIARILVSNEPLTGVVLNHFDVKGARSYYGGKDYEHANYYQNEEST
jgi:polysaccharide biosynthesis transport protein